jgi:RNA polymerase sigma-B factor
MTGVLAKVAVADLSPQEALPLQDARGSGPAAADLLRQLAQLSATDPGRAPLRDRIVESQLPLVRHLVTRFRNLGEPLDDLLQIGTIGLIYAVDRFDPDRGTAFSTYATPTIVGEVKRHLRDRAWAVRPPRRLQELHHQLQAASSAASQQLGRAPTMAELAQFAGVSEESAIEALEAQRACTPVPIELRAADDCLTVIDTGLDGVVDREALRPLLKSLSARHKRILVLRYFRGLSQSEIAAEVGISQMHVSRLLQHIVAVLRTGLADST